MRKIYLKEAQLCSKCNQNVKSFVETSEGLICSKCFIKEAIKSCQEKFSKIKHRRKLFGNRKRNYCTKKIFAVDGITSIYKGGCIN